MTIEKRFLMSQGVPSKVQRGYWQMSMERASSSIFLWLRPCEGMVEGGLGSDERIAQDPVQGIWTL